MVKRLFAGTVGINFDYFEKCLHFGPKLPYIQSGFSKNQGGFEKLELKTKFSCSVCGKYFPRKGDCVRHEASRSFARTGCTVCLEVFCTKHALVIHCIANHMDHSQPDPDSLACQQCGKVFAQKSSLFRHERDIHQKVGFEECSWLKCEICKKQFEREENLKRHMKLVHEPKSDIEFKCDICQKGFTLKAHCKRHEKICTGRR